MWVLRLIEASYHSVLGCDIGVWREPTASIFVVEDCLLLHFFPHFLLLLLRVNFVIVEGRSSTSNYKQLIIRKVKVHTVCAAFNPVNVAEDSRVWDVTQSLGKMIGRIVVLSPSGSGSQRRMKMRA